MSRNHDDSASCKPDCGADRMLRRDFLRLAAGTLAGTLAGAAIGCARLTPAPPALLRFGMVAGAQYTDAAGPNPYRESLARMREAAALFRRERAGCVIELGDFIHAAPDEPQEKTLANLAAIEKELQTFGGPVYHVLGESDLSHLSKGQFLGAAANSGLTEPHAYYSIHRGGLHLIMLDACFRRDGAPYERGDFDERNTHIPKAELDGLRDELAASREPAAVFVHQRLDGDGEGFVMNARQARRVLEDSGRVLAVFQGHAATGGSTPINGIQYYSLAALTEAAEPATQVTCAVVEVQSDLTITVKGFGKAAGAKWEIPKPAKTTSIDTLNEMLKAQ